MINQKQRFIAWLRQQPQRNHPDKLYAEATVNAAANLLESGLQRLGIPGYEGVNCFTITDVDTFRQLHAACYAAAMEFDKNAGYGDFRNGLDFYLQFLTENASGAANTELHKKIRFVIAHYKNNFSATDKNERYKWEALQWYKQHWNMDAPDFAAMLKNAFYKTGNLLNSGPNSLAYTQICQFSKDDPEGNRSPLPNELHIFKRFFKIDFKSSLNKTPTTPRNSRHIKTFTQFPYICILNIPINTLSTKQNAITIFRNALDSQEPPLPSSSPFANWRIWIN